MRITISILLSIFSLLPISLFGQNTRFLSKLIKSNPSFNGIVANPELYQVQIIYSRINRDSKNIPDFKEYAYNLDQSKYFYPANAVNLAAAALVLEKINNLNEPQVDRERYVRIDTAFKTQTQVNNDPIASSGLASYSNFIQRMFALKDEDAYNRCYEFLGQQYFNERMHQLGYPHAWLLHRLGDIDNNTSARHTNPIIFYRNDKIAYYKDIIYLKTWPTTIPFTAVYKQEAAFNPIDYYTGRVPRLQGKKQGANGTTTDEQFEFTNKNEFPLEELHHFLKQIIFPDEDKGKINLSQGDYAFLYKHMGLRSEEMPEKMKLAFDKRKQASNFLFTESALKTDYPSMRVLSNSGKGYGYMVENAYVVDFKNKVEFLLSIVIHCNRTGVVGQEQKYEYNAIGKPFMETIGKLIYQEELTRSKKRSPDLSRFEVF